ncbi:hypothetical protein LPJ66_008507 [Kickxella alabastrina]|uniref:Uncharacterized protein n=1 Tax=Kickxella alabastrina TaxID=61397 RepID=A0ACC1IA56_9FUNG|nr:hypothetical protein LPJ66_008507 [Kickxella alabastrina]
MSADAYNHDIASSAADTTAHGKSGGEFASRSSKDSTRVQLSPRGEEGVDSSERNRDKSPDAGAMASSFLKSMEQTLQRSASRSRSGRDSSSKYQLERNQQQRRGRSSRSPKRSSTSRHRSRSSRRRVEYDDNQRDYEYRPRTYRRRSRSRSRSRHRHRSRESTRRLQHSSGGRREEQPVVALHLRPKKLSMWDLPPPGFESVSCLDAKASGLFPPPGQAAGSRNVASFNPSVLFEHTHREENDRFRPSSRCEREFPSTASRQARRLYVGNMPYGIDEDGIASFFNDLMVRMNIAPADEMPVQNIQINFDKNYAFVEFRDAEQATMGMGLDGVMFQNQKLKIRRPKDYIPPAGQPEPQPPVLSLPGVVSNTVPDSPNKVYVGGLPAYLNEEQVTELLRAFGELKSFNLVKDNVSRLSRGFAFCEYVDPNMTDIACQGLNGMELGDRRLVVQRASVGARGGANPPAMGQQQQDYYPQPNTASDGAFPPHMQQNGGYPQDQSQYHQQQQNQQQYYQPPNASAAFTSQQQQQVMPSAQATSIVQLLNMVTVNELDNDEEYEDILEDVRDECRNFGSILDLVIPRNNPDQPDAPVAGVGKIFIKYQSSSEATAAINALAGRQFMGRTVIASYMSEEDFSAGNF